MSMTQQQLEAALVQIAIAESLSREGKHRAEGNAVANQIATDAALARQIQQQPAVPPIIFAPRPPAPRRHDDGEVPARPAAAAAVAAPQLNFKSNLLIQFTNAEQRRNLLCRNDLESTFYSRSTQSGDFITLLDTSTPALTKGALKEYIKYVQAGQTCHLVLQSPVAVCNNVHVSSIEDANRLLGHLRNVQSVTANRR